MRCLPLENGLGWVVRRPALNNVRPPVLHDVSILTASCLPSTFEQGLWPLTQVKSDMFEWIALPWSLLTPRFGTTGSSDITPANATIRQTGTGRKGATVELPVVLFGFVASSLISVVWQVLERDPPNIDVVT
jgi:hypothetical protein